MSDTAAERQLWIVYDGECPFCSNYVRLVRLRESLGKVGLVNGRDTDHPIVRRVIDAGYDLNEGMALVDGDQIFHGDDCINRLALMSTSSGFFNALNARIFRSKRTSQILYPFLRTGRNATLALLGKKRIEPA